MINIVEEEIDDLKKYLLKKENKFFEVESISNKCNIY